MADVWIVDAFTDAPFAGNPAAVVWLTEPLDEAVLQQIACEFNLSETAFVTPTDKPDRFRLRWFTPVREVNLCGHATLASAHVVWSGGGRPQMLAFETRSGILTARRTATTLELDFPAVPASDHTPIPGLQQALGADFKFVGATTQPNAIDADALVVLRSPHELRALTPDFTALADLRVPSVIATSPSDRNDVDFLTRYFAPRFGINEDPVTGSAHCTAAPYWAGVLRRRRLRAWQESARGGQLELLVRGNRVVLGGSAVTFLHGSLSLPTAPVARAIGSSSESA